MNLVTDVANTLKEKVRCHGNSKCCAGWCPESIVGSVFGSLKCFRDQVFAPFTLPWYSAQRHTPNSIQSACIEIKKGLYNKLTLQARYFRQKIAKILSYRLAADMLVCGGNQVPLESLETDLHRTRCYPIARCLSCSYICGAPLARSCRINSERFTSTRSAQFCSECYILVMLFPISRSRFVSYLPLQRV